MDEDWDGEVGKEDGILGGSLSKVWGVCLGFCTFFDRPDIFGVFCSIFATHLLTRI